MKEGDTVNWELEHGGPLMPGTVTKVTDAGVIITFRLPRGDIAIPYSRDAAAKYASHGGRDPNMEPIPEHPIDRDEAVRVFSRGIAHFAEKIAPGIDHTIARLLKDAQPGDELWLCGRYVGPLLGHRGLGLVRNGEVIRYEQMMTY